MDLLIEFAKGYKWNRTQRVSRKPWGAPHSPVRDVQDAAIEAEEALLKLATMQEQLELVQSGVLAHE